MEFLRILAGIRNSFLTLLFTGFTELAGEAIVLVLICFIFWCFNKKLAYKIGFTYMAAATSVNNLKVLFRIERPWILDPAFKPVESAVAGASGYSFPSGHTCAATSIYGTLALNAKKLWARLLLFAAVIAVMFSRMYLGVHTPLDVSVSFAVSLIIAIVVILLSKKADFTKKKAKLILCICFAIYTIFSIVLPYVLELNGVINYGNAADGVKVAGGALGFLLGWLIESSYVNFDPRACKWPMQLLKLVLGVAALLLLKTGLKIVFEAICGGTEHLLLAALRYFMLVFFAFGLYPMAIKKFFN